MVHYAWDVTTRQEYALKEPLPDKGSNMESWRKEAQIMKDISHVSKDQRPKDAEVSPCLANGGANNYSTQDHIIKLKHASFESGPQLYFEYVPGGSLERYLSATTSFHNEKITIQLLSGLGYLHTQETPITHRDIKPENVLVQAWSPESVHVKLADFGLSKQAERLKTYCGTLLYAAPELYCLQDDPKYGPLVDIWSVAVLLVRLECGQLAKYPDHYQTSGTAWAEALVAFVQAHLRRHGADRLLLFLLEDLVVKPEGRQSALKCHVSALQLFKHEASETLSRPVELVSSQTTTDHSPPSSDDDDESDPATPRVLPADMATESQDLGTTIIASLGYRDAEAIDSRLGLKPSDMSAHTRRGGSSLVEGDLWFVPVEEEEEEEKKKRGAPGLQPSRGQALSGPSLAMLPIRLLDRMMAKRLNRYLSARDQDWKDMAQQLNGSHLSPMMNL